MTDFFAFIQDHLLVSSVFITLLFVVIIYEYNLAQNKQDLNVPKAIDLINHENAAVFDFRNRSQFQASHIVNSINLELESLSDNAKKITKYKTKNVIVVSEPKQRAVALKQLSNLGFSNVYFLQGGIQAWLNENMPVVTK